MSFRIVAVALIVAGCSSSTDDLVSKSDTLTIEADFDRNYQAVYRDLSNTATRCLSGASVGISSFHVDHELYSELGFGEIAYRLSNWGTANFYWKAVIKKTGPSKSRLTVWSGNTINNENWAAKVAGWAGGSDRC